MRPALYNLADWLQARSDRIDRAVAAGTVALVLVNTAVQLGRLVGNML